MTPTSYASPPRAGCAHASRPPNPGMLTMNRPSGSVYVPITGTASAPIVAL